MRRRCAVLVLAAFTFVAAALLPAAANGQMHEGFLPGPGAFGTKPLNLLGTTQVTSRDTKPDLVADVAVDPDGDYAYLARWGGSDCAGPEVGGQNSPDGGVYIIDIADLTNPVEVGFIATQ